jgi:hypothetical protein
VKSSDDSTMPPVAPRLSPSQVARLYERARADYWDLPRERFEAALVASAERAFQGITATSTEVEEYLDGLYLEDLALALACEMGVERAWEHFVAEYRPLLTRAADAIDPTGGARELADSIHGEVRRANATARADHCSGISTAEASSAPGSAPCSPSAMSIGCGRLAGPNRCPRMRKRCRRRAHRRILPVKARNSGPSSTRPWRPP